MDIEEVRNDFEYLRADDRGLTLSSDDKSGILLGRHAVISLMEPVDGGSRLLTFLEESLCPDPDVEFVVTFGSQVTGDFRPSSDLDVAVKFTDGLSRHERFQKQCFLSGDLQRADAPFIDVSDIEELPLDVAHDAVNGEFLCGDEEAFLQFKADTEAVFEERCDDIRRHQREVIDRIAEKGLHG